MKWLFALILLHLCQGITLQLGSQQCFKVKGGQQYRVQYVISGVNEENVIFKATRGDDILLRSFHKRQFSDVVSLPVGDINLCVESTDSEYKMLTIDFYSLADPLKNIVTQHDLGTIQKRLTTLIEEMRGSYRNQLFQSERDQVHRNVLDQTDKKIQWLSIFKVVLLFAVAIGQLCIIKGFLKARDNQYNPVRT